MSTSISSLKDQLPVQILAIEVISKDYKLKYANFLKIPDNEKKMILVEFDESVTAMIYLLENDYKVAPSDSGQISEELIDLFKSEILRSIVDRGIDNI